MQWKSLWKKMVTTFLLLGLRLTKWNFPEQWNFSKWEHNDWLVFTFILELWGITQLPSGFAGMVSSHFPNGNLENWYWFWSQLSEGIIDLACYLSTHVFIVYSKTVPWFSPMHKDEHEVCIIYTLIYGCYHRFESLL